MALQLVESEDGWSKPPPFGQELGSSFSWHDRLFQGYRDGKVFDYSDWEARDLEEMMRKGYKARQLEGVLTGPLMSATHTMAPAKNDHGEFEWMQNWLELDEFSGGMKTPFDLIVSQMATAVVYKKAFWEKVWEPTPDGKVGYGKMAWRPQSTCRLMRDPVTGDLEGFEQEAYGIGPQIIKGKWPIQVQMKNAMVYVHGQHRDPINGISDLEIAYWCWKTQQKLLFLWFNYLENTALGKIIVRSNDIGTAVDVANQIAKMKGSGVLPVGVPGGPTSVMIDQLDTSGQRGASEFMSAITWLDQAAANSIQAGFTNLTNYEKNGGSYALSSNASDFYLQSLEYKNKERARELRRQFIAPVLRLNFPNAAIPTFEFEPLNTEDKTQAVEMLTMLMRSRDPALIPDEFIGELATQVADYLGMDGKQVRAAFDRAAKEAKVRAAAMAAAGATQPGQQVAGVAGAVGAAGRMLGSGGAPKQPRGQSIPGINAPQLPTAY